MGETPQKGRRTRLDRAIDEAEERGVRVFADFDAIGLPRFSAQVREGWGPPGEAHTGPWVTAATGRDLEDLWWELAEEPPEPAVGEPRAMLMTVLAEGSVVYDVPDAEAFSALTERFTRLNRVCGTLGMGKVKIIEWAKQGGAHWRPTATLQATRAARAVDEALDVLKGAGAGTDRAEMLATIARAVDVLEGRSNG